MIIIIKKKSHSSTCVAIVAMIAIVWRSVFPRFRGKVEWVNWMAKRRSRKRRRRIPIRRRKWVDKNAISLFGSSTQEISQRNGSESSIRDEQNATRLDLVIYLCDSLISSHRKSRECKPFHERKVFFTPIQCMNARCNNDIGCVRLWIDRKESCAKRTERRNGKNWNSSLHENWKYARTNLNGKTWNVRLVFYATRSYLSIEFNEQKKKPHLRTAILIDVQQLICAYANHFAIFFVVVFHFFFNVSYSLFAYFSSIL